MERISIVSETLIRHIHVLSSDCAEEVAARKKLHKVNLQRFLTYDYIEGIISLSKREMCRLDFTTDYINNDMHKLSRIITWGNNSNNQLTL
jgi:hypothetical protein